MSLFIAILLYLSQIVSPGTYYQSEIDQLIDDNQASINAILNDPAAMQDVEDNYVELVEDVVIWQDDI